MVYCSPVDIEVRMDELKEIKCAFQEMLWELDDLYDDDTERIANKDDDHVDRFNSDYYDLLASM